MVLVPPHHQKNAIARAGRHHSEYFYCKNGKLCCILFVFFKSSFLWSQNFSFYFLFLHLFLFSPFSLHFYTLILHWRPMHSSTPSPYTGELAWTQDFPGYSLWPVVITPPTSSDSPSPTPAALFADNLIVKAAMGSIKAYRENWRISYSYCQLLMTSDLLGGPLNMAREWWWKTENWVESILKVNRYGLAQFGCPAFEI